MKDPFLLLDVDPAVGAAGLASAYARAVRSGARPAEARRAMDVLRDPVTREAAALLAVSQTPSYHRIRMSSEPDAKEVALEVMLEIVGAVVADMERYLSSSEVLPSITVRRDVRDYVPAPMEALDP